MKNKSQVPYGIQQGTFNVDTSGQSTYNVPINLPPGINNHHPTIGLTYSQRQGNGACGIGWGISGLSAITRINANQSTDGFIGSINYDANDRYALDGQRLVNYNGDFGAGGTIYYTEIHSWRQIVAGATDKDGFIVYMKNGEIWSYGTTPDSLILTEDAKHVRVWALASIKDLNGNEITYSYTSSPTGTSGLNNTENYYISSIQYSRFTISFNYSNRTKDVTATYLGGYQIITSCILNSIDVSVNAGETISSYSLCYETSIATQLTCLNSIVISDGSGNCLPPLKFDWQDIPTPSFDTTQETSALLNLSNLLKTLPMDVNGDGITDIVQLYMDENNCIHAVVFLAFNNLGKITYKQQSDTLIGNYSHDYQILAADCNGNGMCDLIIIYSDKSNDLNLSIDVLLSTGTGFAPPSTTQTSDPWQGNSSISFYTVDVNGDGRTDLVQAFKDSSSGANLLSFNIYVSTFIGTEGNFSSSTLVQTQSQAPASSNNLWAIDVNGDGMVDMVLLWEDENGMLNTSSYITKDSVTSGIQFFSSLINSNLKTSTTNQVSILPADVNGDGIIDIVQICQSSSTPLTIRSFFSSANGSFIIGPTSTFRNQIIANNFKPMGFNGGSQTSLLSSWLDSNSNWNFTLFNSSPNGTFNVIPSVNTQQAFSTLRYFIGDANGNGKADVFSHYLDSENTIQLQLFPSEGPYPDLMNSITDMLGNCTTIVYAPLTNPVVYSDDSNDYPYTSPVRYPSHLSPAQYPIQEVLGKAVYVVSNFSIKNNSTLNRFDYFHEYQMSYANASINLNGRGWQGFRTVSELDLQTGLRKIQTYNQEFPYTGTLISAKIEADANYSDDPKVLEGDTNVLLSLSLNTHQSILHQASTSYGTAYEIQNTGNLLYHYDYGQANFDYLIAKSFNYDSYGNIIKDTWWGYIDYINPYTINSLAPFPSVTPKDSGEIVYTYRQYQNNILTNGWVLGYLLFEKESANATDADITRFQNGDLNLAERTYAASTYNVLTQAHWDNINNCFLTTSFTYDQYGNHLTETKPGNFTTVFEYETTYNTYPSKVTSPPNEQGVTLVSYQGYDPRYGIEIAHQNENGYINIVNLDGFGRKFIEQGPVPSGCNQSDANAVAPVVTGTPDFIEKVKTAKVLTLQTSTFENDGAGGIYMQQNTLQSYPTDASRSFTWTKNYIDALNRTVQDVVQSGSTQGDSFVLTSYDPCGHVSVKSVPFFSTSAYPSVPQPTAGYSVSYVYDVLGRVLTQNSPYGLNGNIKTTTNTFNYSKGHVATSTEASDNTESYTQLVTSHFYLGQLKQVTSVTPGGATTTFTYDALGRLLTSKDPIDIVNTFTYDSLNRKFTSDNPDQNTVGGTTKTMTYNYSNITSDLSSTVEASGSSITFTYDNLGRIITKTCTDGRVFQYRYDNSLSGTQNSLGRISEVTVFSSASGPLESSKAFYYDSYGNVINHTLQVTAGTKTKTFSTSYAYDPMKRVISKTMPDNSTASFTYEYGLMTSQSIGDTAINYPLKSYTASGLYSQYSCYNNCNNILTADYTYNSVGVIYNEALTNNVSNKTLLSYTNNYDHLNQLLSSAESVNNVTNSYSYTNKRLTGTSIPGSINPNSTYTYNNGGNITSKDGNTYTSYNAHFVNTIQNSEGSTIYSATQDSVGRIQTSITEGITLTYNYNTIGAITSVSNGTTALSSFVTDESGLRLATIDTDPSTGNITTTYYVSSSYLVEELTASGSTSETIKKYLLDGSGQAASITTFSGGSSTVQFYRRDTKKSVTQVINGSTGEITNTIIYDGFGLQNSTSSLPNDTDPTYEGRTWNAQTGLYYFSARYYNPAVGQFITPDTQLGSSSILRQDALNRFAFELNSPVNGYDPTGHSVLGNIFGALSIAFSAVAIAAGVALCLTGVGAVAGGSLIVSGVLGVASGGTAIAATNTSGKVSSNLNYASLGLGIGSAITGVCAGVAGYSVATSAARVAATATVSTGAAVETTGTTATSVAYGTMIFSGTLGAGADATGIAAQATNNKTIGYVSMGIGIGSTVVGVVSFGAGLSKGLSGGYFARPVEVYYRTMSAADDTFLTNNHTVPATRETCISPSLQYARNYGGITRRLRVRFGTTAELEGIGVKQPSTATNNVYSRMPNIARGWINNGQAMFKFEGNVMNIGLGRSGALDLFNNNIISV